MTSEHKKHFEIKKDKNAYVNLPSFANFRVKMPMRLPRRWGQKKKPKGSSRYIYIHVHCTRITVTWTTKLKTVSLFLSKFRHLNGRSICSRVVRHPKDLSIGCPIHWEKPYEICDISGIIISFCKCNRQFIGVIVDPSGMGQSSQSGHNILSLKYTADTSKKIGKTNQL